MYPGPLTYARQNADYRSNGTQSKQRNSHRTIDTLIGVFQRTKNYLPLIQPGAVGRILIEECFNNKLSYIGMHIIQVSHVTCAGMLVGVLDKMLNH